MAFQIIDTSGAQTSLLPATAQVSWGFTQITQLEGAEYVFQFYWNWRESCWYLSIFDQDQNALCLGIKLVVSWSLLRKFRSLPNIPPGALFCMDQTGVGTDIQAATDLGVRVALVYITSDDAALTGLTY